MNQKEFINAIRIAVADSAKKSIESILANPPGRKPNRGDVELSDWFKALDEENKDFISRVIKRTADMAVFGFLCVLDGVRAIEYGPDKGNLNLYYEKNGNTILLNDADEEYLHDIWNAVD